MAYKMMSNSKHISLPKPMAEGDLTDWFLKYEIVVCQMTGEMNWKLIFAYTAGRRTTSHLAWEQQASYKTAKAKVIKVLKAMAPVCLFSSMIFLPVNYSQMKYYPYFSWTEAIVEASYAQS